MRNKYKSSLNAILVIVILQIITSISLQSQWVKQPSPVFELLSAVKFINQNTGWVCSTIDYNAPSYIMKTTNGGSNWNIQYTGSGYITKAIAVPDSLTVYAGGMILMNSMPFLMKSTNGGINWVNKNPPTSPLDLYFSNKDSGWYCTFYPVNEIRTTTDGGTTWQIKMNGVTTTLLSRIHFHNYNTGWCGGSYYLYKTTNAGTNWIQIGIFSSTIASVFFYNQNTGWAGLGNGKVAYTSNGGSNWTYQSTPAEGAAYGVTDLYFFNNLKGFAGTRSYKILKTYNGGQTWGYQIDSAYSERISFVDSLTGWSVFWHIRKTTNGGGPIIYTGFNSISNEVPASFKLYQNYPNPFNPSTTIKVDVNKHSLVNMVIYDQLGRVLYKIENQYLKPGSYEFIWDSSNYSSGIYYLKFVTDNFADTKKMVLVK